MNVYDLRISVWLGQVFMLLTLNAKSMTNIPVVSYAYFCKSVRHNMLALFAREYHWGGLTDFHFCESMNAMTRGNFSRFGKLSPCAAPVWALPMPMRRTT